MTPKEVITKWGQIYRWDGGDAHAEAAEEAIILIQELLNAGYEIVPTCIGCRDGIGNVHEWSGIPWHHDPNGNQITACTMPMDK